MLYEAVAASAAEKARITAHLAACISDQNRLPAFERLVLELLTAACRTAACNSVDNDYRCILESGVIEAEHGLFQVRNRAVVPDVIGTFEEIACCVHGLETSSVTVNEEHTS